jgi:hypothetical protein
MATPDWAGMSRKTAGRASRHEVHPTFMDEDLSPMDENLRWLSSSMGKTLKILRFYPPKSPWMRIWKGHLRLISFISFMRLFCFVRARIQPLLAAEIRG